MNYNQGREEMKYFVSLLAVCLFTVDAIAVTPAGQGRRAAAQQFGAAPRATASKNQLNPTVSVSTTPSVAEAAVTVDKSSVRVDPDISISTAPTKDMREKERAACINNNIGVGNTFVWASRYSNTNNYASMVEDVDEPENNVCFVKVELKSDDSKISVADIPSQYFVMGQTITCGSWADAQKLEKRILDAKKSSRTWATVGGAVGGAAVGVGAMELFGNKLIGGSVQGQKALSGTELLYSQLSVLKKENASQFNEVMRHLQNLKRECESTMWAATESGKPEQCDLYDYDKLLSLKGI